MAGFLRAYLISGWMAGGTYFRYPTVKAAAWTPMTVNFMLVYLALVLTPVILDRRGGQAVELFAIKHLNFAYPEQAKNAISDFSLSVRPGEFLGGLRSVRLREIDAAVAVKNRPCAARTKERSNPV